MDGLFDSFGVETILDVDDVQNYDDVGKLTNETDHDSGSIFDRYLDTSDDKSYSHEPRATAVYRAADTGWQLTQGENILDVARTWSEQFVAVW